MPQRLPPSTTRTQRLRHWLMVFWSRQLSTIRKAAPTGDDGGGVRDADHNDNSTVHGSNSSSSE